MGYIKAEYTGKEMDFHIKNATQLSVWDSLAALLGAFLTL
jgi:hypothetical protein